MIHRQSANPKNKRRSGGRGGTLEYIIYIFYYSYEDILTAVVKNYLFARIVIYSQCCTRSTRTLLYNRIAIDEMIIANKGGGGGVCGKNTTF